MRFVIPPSPCVRVPCVWTRLCVCVCMYVCVCDPPQRARLSLHCWQRFRYDYYGYGHGWDGEVGVGHWHERVVGDTVPVCGSPDEHILPHIPPMSSVDPTRSLEEDQAAVRAWRRQWYHWMAHSSLSGQVRPSPAAPPYRRVTVFV